MTICKSYPIKKGVGGRVEQMWNWNPMRKLYEKKGIKRT